MSEPFDRYKNPDGKTYNGVKMMAELTGLTKAEVAWTFNRLKHLMQVEGKPKDVAKLMVKQEAKSKPWLAP